MKIVLTLFFGAFIAFSFAGVVEEPPCDTPPQPEPTTSPPEPKCGENEELSTCKKPCPPETCITLYVTPSCLASPCTTGCVCKKGFLRKEENSPCIPISECPPRPEPPTTVPPPTPPPTKPAPPPTTTVRPKPSCNSDEEYDECGTACQSDCSNYEDLSRACTANCVQGCFCKKGLVRRSKTDKTCIEPRDCPKKPTPPPTKPAPPPTKPAPPPTTTVRPKPSCNSDEEYNDCGTACQSDCSNYKNPGACTAQCVQGCFCKKGLVRRSKTDQTCVEPCDCPK